ncbi:MAG: ATP-dependent zinc metalloprotease FtsH [Selenomonadaceae bacterium]|nr:ATP-dependent zinc metalloprotease FtsH [Selenomonadaceae bacterium]
MEKFFKNMMLYLLVIMIAVTLIDSHGSQKGSKKEIDYTGFMTKVEEGSVAKVTITDNVIRGSLSDGTEFTATVPQNDNEIIGKLRAKNVNIKVENPIEPPWWSSVLMSVLPVVVIVGAIAYFMGGNNNGPGRLFSFGKSKARMTMPDNVKVNFSDVAGADEAKEGLEEVVEFLKEPDKFSGLGAKIPKGVLLFGSPGTGKTLLAKAVAGEAGVPFFSISGSDFVEMFVGVGASRVRDLFNNAKREAPCIVFIDEIDAVGRQRGAGVGGGHDEREQTLNQLLVEMDGFETNEGIIVIAATNRPDILDPALLRPGRFDRQITVDRPDVKGREAILKVHTKNKPISDDVDLTVLARRTPGFSGADLANLVNEAALLSARRNQKTVTMATMEEAVERVMAGPERKSKVMSDRERKLTAYHEGGHTLTGMKLPNADPVHKVTIIPRGRAGGYTLMLPQEDRSYETRSQLRDQLTTLLGGRVAEEIILHEISTGASSDIERASQLARAMITQYGMSDKLGPINYGAGENHQVFLGRELGQQRNYSEEIAAEIDKEVQRYISESYENCRKILEENIDDLHAIAAALMEKETLHAKELEAIVAETEAKRYGTEEATAAAVAEPEVSQQGDNDRI